MQKRMRREMQNLMIYDVTWFLLTGAVAAVIAFYVSGRKHLPQEHILNAMPEGVIFFDKREVVRYFNPAAAALFPELAVKKRLGALKHFTEYEELENILLFREEQLIRINVKPVYYHGISVGYWAGASDCTQEKKYKEEILDLKRQVEDANRAKVVFLASMSHEIRTPMNAVLGVTQFMLQEAGLTEHIKRNLTDIRRSGESLLSMVDNVLDLAKLESGTMEIIPKVYRTRDFLQDIEKRMAVILEGRDIAFRMDIDPKLPSLLYGDILRLYQIFFNFLINAAKYTDFGRIMLEIHGRDTGEEDESGRKKIELEIAVSDTGTGIKEELLSTLFEAFQHTETVKNSFGREGVRLGLSIVRHLIVLMGGSIEVRSVFGCGTTFMLRLPQGVEDAAPIKEYCQGEYITEPPEEAGSAHFTACRACVLIVDDNMVNLRVLKELIAVYKIQVSTAASGLECLEMLKSRHYDLIFMDFMMPKMDGMETLKMLRDMPGMEEIPVIAVTANTVDSAGKMFIEAGFQAYITKPVELKILEQVLYRFLPQELVEEASASTSTVDEKEDIYQKGLSLFGGNREQYLTIVRSVMEEGEELAIQLCKELAEDDFESYIIHMHTLKGITATIGADYFSARAKELELAGKEGRFDYIRGEHQKVLDAFYNLLNHMRAWIASERLEKREEEEMPVIQDIQLLELLGQIRECLEDFYRDQAAALVKYCLSCRLDTFLYSGLSEIGSMIAGYEYDRPAQKTAELMEYIRNR